MAAIPLRVQGSNHLGTSVPRHLSPKRRYPHDARQQLQWHRLREGLPPSPSPTSLSTIMIESSLVMPALSFWASTCSFAVRANRLPFPSSRPCPESVGCCSLHVVVLCCASALVANLQLATTLACRLGYTRRPWWFQSPVFARGPVGPPLLPCSFLFLLCTHRLLEHLNRKPMAWASGLETRAATRNSQLASVLN